VGPLPGLPFPPPVLPVPVWVSSGSCLHEMIVAIATMLHRARIEIFFNAEWFYIDKSMVMFGM
jgi:hypothetical protein